MFARGATGRRFPLRGNVSTGQRPMLPTSEWRDADAARYRRDADAPRRVSAATDRI